MIEAMKVREFSPAPGYKVIVKPLMPYELEEPEEVAEHEASHIIGAIYDGSSVEEATIAPGPGYLGRTKIGIFSPIAFAAAEARGCNGTGHDLGVLAARGYDVNVVVGAARSLLSKLYRQVYLVASLLQAQKTISGYQAEEVIEADRNPRAEVTIIYPTGQERTLVQKVRRVGNYFIPIDLAA